MVDALVALLPTAVAQWMFGASPPGRSGNRHPLSTPFGAYAAADGHVVICVLNAQQFAGLARCMGRPGLADDPRYASDELRTRHEPELSALIRAWLMSQTVAGALGALQAAGVPASRIAEPSEVFASRQIQERGVLTTVRHSRLGMIPALEQPVHFAGLSRGHQRAAPGLDEHHDTVIARWLGAGSTP
jgi:CoA:oxalate CoA-transferase